MPGLESGSLVVTDPIGDLGGNDASRIGFRMSAVLRRPGVFWAAVAWLATVAALAALAPWLPLRSATHLSFTPAAPPSMDHLLGTDSLSRDMLARVIWGARASLFIGIGAVTLAFVVGTTLGLLAGYVRGIVDGVVVAISEVTLSFPLFVLAVAITGYAGHGTVQVTCAIGVGLTPSFMRIARASTLSVLQRDYVLAATSIGASPRRLLLEDVLPNVLPTLLTLATTLTAVAIVAEGGLSFLGVGIQPPTPSWGSMIAEGREVLANSPQVSLIPAAVMFITVFSLTVIGDRFQGSFFEVD
jgi:peptide/nickel transport system permease protein